MCHQQHGFRRTVSTSGTPSEVTRPPGGSRAAARELSTARTQLAETMAALQAMQVRCAKLEETASREVLDRLAEASHDLRGPLQVIGMDVDMLTAGFCGTISDRQREHLDRVRAHVDHLAALIASVLTLARATHPGGALELRELSIAHVLDQLRTQVEPLAAGAGVSLVVDYPGTPASVRCEPTALLRVLVNLAGNAITVTRPGRAVVISTAADSSAVELRVADHGPGIPTGRLHAVFEPYVRFHAADAVERGSVGLGLTIARDLTRLMGGELHVQSVVGIGSVFAVRFPATPARAVRQVDAIAEHAA